LKLINWRIAPCNGLSNDKLHPHGAASCRWRDPAALTGRPGHPISETPAAYLSFRKFESAGAESCRAIFLQSLGVPRHNQIFRRYQIVNCHSGPQQSMPAGETDNACCAIQYGFSLSGLPSLPQFCP
jgi:hypothetical protein